MQAQRLNSWIWHAVVVAVLMMWSSIPAQDLATTNPGAGFNWSRSAATNRDDLKVFRKNRRFEQSDKRLQRDSTEASLSPWATEVVKLAQANIQEDIILTFIDSSGTFNLGADQIIYLSELEVSPSLVTAMIQHDADVISGARPLTISSTPSTAGAIQIVLARSTVTPENEAKPSAVQPASLTLARNEPAELFQPFPLPTEPPSHPTPESPALASQIAEPKANLTKSASQQTVVQEDSSLYRVREPYPEPITAPFLVFRKPGLQPNTIVIQFAP